MSHGNTLRSHRHRALDTGSVARRLRMDAARFSQSRDGVQSEVPPAVVGFSVCRSVFTIYGKLPKDHLLAQEFRKTDPLRGEGLRFSLITSTVGRIIGQRFQGPTELLKAEIQESIHGLPPVLYAQLGAVSIFGASRGHAGRRFIAYCLEGPSQAQLKDELEIFHKQYPVRKKSPVPHLSVYATFDQAYAECIAEQLRNSTPAGLTVGLLEPK